MSFIDPSMEPMMEMFIYESSTLLDQLDEIMLESEKANCISDDHINEIFRIMHTIKGSSAMMGFSGISTLAHAVEDVFFIIRENPQKLQLVNEAMFDLMFQASDFLKAEVEAVQGDEYTPQDPTTITSRLEEQVKIMDGQAAQAPENANTPPAPIGTSEPPAAEPGAAQTLTAEVSEPEPPLDFPAPDGTYTVRIFFDDECQMENIRAFMLLSQLKDWCEEISSVPEHPENDSSLCPEIIKHGFVIHFKPASTAEDVYKVIESSINVKSYEALHTTSEAADLGAEASAGISMGGIPAAAPSDGAAVSAATETATVSPAAGAAPAAAAAMPKMTSKQSLISVNQTKLDQLMDLVGELVTTESMVSSNPDLKGLVLDNFYKSTRELRKLTDELQDVVMSIRMVPLSGVFQKMNRIIRDMSKKLGKEVEFETIGGETEVDKTINDSIADPFMHMIRNSMDHAIEAPEVRRALGKPEIGKVTIAARNVGGEIVINISDDGAGLNSEKIMAKAKNNNMLTKPETEYTDKEIFGFIMLPGFSTNAEVTEYSGRGVGMDVVRKNIEKVGGTISVDSEKDVGTTFTIKIPLTLAIVDGMEISVGTTVFTLPITSIKQQFKIFDSSQIIHNTDGSEMIMLRGDCYPILRLHEMLGIPTNVTEICDGIVIQVESGHKVGCIFADELLGEQQVVVKPFPLFLNKYGIKGKGLSGCTILGDGSISLILDANSLLNI